jgi:hypothetical protein
VLVLAGAASTFSPTSMSLSSASTVAALGMPLSDPCSTSAPTTTPSATKCKQKHKPLVRNRFTTVVSETTLADSRGAPAGWLLERQSPIWASLDATNVRFRSQFDALASSAFIFASTVKPFAGRDCIIAPERG